MTQVGTLIVVFISMVVVFGAITVASRIYNLNSIKSKTVGDGQHGTARWARKDEIKQTYLHIPYEPKKWRKGQNLPRTNQQGIFIVLPEEDSSKHFMVSLIVQQLYREILAVADEHGERAKKSLLITPSSRCSAVLRPTANPRRFCPRLLVAERCSQDP